MGIVERPGLRRGLGGAPVTPVPGRERGRGKAPGAAFP
jgi:hypothetical protein